MGRLLAGLGSAFGLAWLWRKLQGPRTPPQPPQEDPAAELRARLEQARVADDDRDEFDAAEGQPVDEVERPPAAPEPTEEPPAVPEEPQEQQEQTLSLDERRRAVHEKAQQALGEMDRLGRDD
jgi:type IV secretory pathway VirB10-like protein